MTWEAGRRYRGKAVQGQAQVERNKNTGTESVHVMIEVVHGDCTGRRTRSRGYLNSPTNIDVTIAELRAMGWKGAKLGDWAGLGTKEVEFTLLSEVSTSDGKTYYRAGFIRPLATLNAERSVEASSLDELNARLGAALNPTRVIPTNGVVPTPAAEGDAPQDEIPF